MKKYTIKYCFHGSFIEVECDDFGFPDLGPGKDIPLVKDKDYNNRTSVDFSKVIAWQVTENSYYPDSYEEKWKRVKELIDETEKMNFFKEYEKHGNYEEPLGKDVKINPEPIPLVGKYEHAANIKPEDFISFPKPFTINSSDLSLEQLESVKEEIEKDIEARSNFNFEGKDYPKINVVKAINSVLNSKVVSIEYKDVELLKHINRFSEFQLSVFRNTLNPSGSNEFDITQKDIRCLKVCHDRLVKKYDENPKEDHMIFLRDIINRMEMNQPLPLKKRNTTSVKGDIKPGEDLPFKKSKDRKQIEKHLKIAYESMENIKSLLKSSGFKL